MNLVLAITGAAHAFRDGRLPRLGITYSSTTPKEHWTRVKALARRLGHSWSDECDSLRPVADSRRELVDRVYRFAQNPLRWEGSKPTEEEQQTAHDALAENVVRRLARTPRRVATGANASTSGNGRTISGRGFATIRSEIIDGDIYQPAAPVPDMTPSPDRNHFLHDVLKEAQAAADEVGAQLI
jgi:hypothetical protein